MSLNSHQINMDVLCKTLSHNPVQPQYHHQPPILKAQHKETKINNSLTSADLSHLDNENFLIKEITSTKLDLLNGSGGSPHLNHVNDQEKPKSGFLNSKFFVSQTPECNLCKNHISARETQKQMDEMVDMDSGIQSRPESVDESVKKRIYQQAIDINQRTLVNPRTQRIQDSVSKIFGLDDPPAGFGLIYPKYYYLEQKKPQPMQPLKVWRGFNGNIYFEPIKFQNLSTKTEKSATATPASNSAKTSHESNPREPLFVDYDSLSDELLEEANLRGIKTQEELVSFLEEQLDHRKHLNTRESVRKLYSAKNKNSFETDQEEYVEYEGEEIGGDEDEEEILKAGASNKGKKPSSVAQDNKARLNSILKNRKSNQKESSFLNQATPFPETATHSANFHQAQHQIVKFEKNNPTVDENAQSPDEGDESRPHNTRAMAASSFSKYPFANQTNTSPSRAQTLFSSYMNNRSNHYINGKIMTKGNNSPSRGDSSRDTIYYDENDMEKLRAAYANAQYHNQLQNANAHLYRPPGPNSAVSQSSRVILPNLNAVQKGNMPIKGLAFKEARHRIEFASTPFLDSNSNLQNTNYYMLNEYDLTQARSRGATANGGLNPNTSLEARSRQGAAPSRSYQLDMLPSHLYVNDDSNNNNNMNDNAPINLKLKSMEQKRPYKQMLKGLKKGVTLNYNRNSTETSADIEAALAESIDMKNNKQQKQQQMRKKTLKSAPLRTEQDSSDNLRSMSGKHPKNSLMMRLLSRRQQFNNIKVLKIKGDALISNKVVSDDPINNHHLVTNTPNHTISTTPFTNSPSRLRRSRESNSTFTSVTRYSHSNAQSNNDEGNNPIKETRSLSRRNTTMRQKLVNANANNSDIHASKNLKSETPQSAFTTFNNFSRTTNHSELLETPDLNEKPNQ